MKKGDIIKADVKTKTHWGDTITLIGSATIEILGNKRGVIKKGEKVYGQYVWEENGEWFCNSEFSHRPMPQGQEFRDMIEWGLRDH